MLLLLALLLLLLLPEGVACWLPGMLFFCKKLLWTDDVILKLLLLVVVVAVSEVSCWCLVVASCAESCAVNCAVCQAARVLQEVVALQLPGHVLVGLCLCLDDCLRSKLSRGLALHELHSVEAGHCNQPGCSR